MLRTLKILCILLKVLMLTAIAFSEDLEDLEASIIPSFKILNVHDYISSSIGYVQNSVTVTVKNEVALQEGTTPSPEGTPSEPTFPRTFVEFSNRLNKTDIFVTFRWNEPKLTNGMIQKYRIQYWFSENLETIQISVDISPAKILQHKVYNLKPDTMYYFKVQAYNVVGAGPYTKFINVSTTNENPVRLLLVSSFNGVRILDMDLQIQFALTEDNFYGDIAYSALEHKIYWITGNRLKIYDLNLSAIATKPNFTKIVDLDVSSRVIRGSHPRSLCIDWVARNLYWMEYTTMTIMKLDLTLLQMGKVKYDRIRDTNWPLSYLNVLPSKGYLYWSEHNSETRHIMQSDLDGKNMKPLLNIGNNECSFSYKESGSVFRDTFQIDMNTEIPLVYWIQEDSLFAAAINGSCERKLIFSAKNQKFNYLAIDKINIYLYSKNKKLIYILNKKYAVPESKGNVFKRVQKVHISLEYSQKILSLDKSLQPYPPTKCLTPNMKDYHVEEELRTDNSIVVRLPEPVLNNECEKYNLATTIYTISVSYLICLDNDLKKIKEFKVQTYERRYKFQNLTPFTEYTFKLALSNFYFDKLSIGLQFGEDVKLTTTGKLNTPEDVTVQVLTSTLAAVYWMPPKNLSCVTVNYEVHWDPVLLPNSTRKIASQNEKINQPKRTKDGKFFTTIQSLLPKQKYIIYVRVYPINFRNFFTDSLNKSIYMYSELNNLTMSKVSTNGMNISWIPRVNLTHYILEYKNNAMREWQIANNTEKNNDKVTYYIENLLPRTLYKFRLILRYPEYMEDFTWPHDGEEFTFETLGNAPRIPLILSIVVTLVVTLVICVCYFYYSYRQRQASKTIFLPSIITDIESPTLYKTPSGNVQSNAVYDAKSIYNLDEFALTTIEKKQIILGEFLGSGAFGKIFQGFIKDFEGSDTTPVAIKTQRENATSKERMELLEEAKLLSDLRHKHVLRFLGICLDSDSPWIISELMEAGDLLKYLRENRTLQPSDRHALRLQDLLAMCEDVARGCCYLEEQHFVHRDLACRNCLISARNRKKRIVKIGDFGLARDIYKDDYYCMEGETSLPVRWMAPESLKYRKFTSKSDVWAFGVLMWEITSLGQQPYYARNDIEVCIYVCAGGKLSIPLNCPSALYQLMLSCWNAMKERPKFKLCLENIVTLRDNIEDAMLSSVDIIRRVQLPSSEKPEYLQMEDF